jgi:hypothetical protein
MLREDLVRQQRQSAKKSRAEAGAAKKAATAKPALKAKSTTK